MTDRIGSIVRRYRVEEALGVLLDVLAQEHAAFNVLPPAPGMPPTWQANVYYGTGQRFTAEGVTPAAALVSLLHTLEGQRGQGGA